jgi:N-(2-amino-2-carboxyethyl)-L-glutamate synthase
MTIGDTTAPTALADRLRDSAAWRLIGGTPLVELRRLAPPRARVYAKLEGFNPGGSVKDRSAARMLAAALDRGDIGPDTTVIESSSGNMAIGLAQLCAVLGLRLICVVDPRTSTQNIRLLSAYGAELDVVEQPDPVTGEYLPARMARVRELLGTHPRGYWPNQYANEANAAAHATTTMPEIAAGIGDPPDYLYCAVSTCGTLAGCAAYVRAHGWPTRIVAVDAVGSRIFPGARPAPRVLPGLGAAIRPGLADTVQPHEIVRVSDVDCVRGCHLLLRREGILAGASSGGVVAAMLRISHADEGRVRRHVMVLADRGERYGDTVFNPDWVSARLGIDLSGEPDREPSQWSSY